MTTTSSQRSTASLLALALMLSLWLPTLSGAPSQAQAAQAPTTAPFVVATPASIVLM